MITLFLNNLGVPDAAASGTALPTTLSGVSVSVRVIGALNTYNYPSSLGILRVATEGCPSLLPVKALTGYCPTTEVTVQIPTNLVYVTLVSGACEPFFIPPALVLNVVANGTTGPDLPVGVLTFNPHLLNSCDRILGPPSATCNDLVTHADGSLVSFASPARVGEEVVTYAVGYGVTNVVSNEAMKFTFVAGQPFAPSYTTQVIQSVYSGSVPGFVGLYQINFVIPQMPAQTIACQAGLNNAILGPDTGNSGTLERCVIS